MDDLSVFSFVLKINGPMLKVVSNSPGYITFGQQTCLFFLGTHSSWFISKWSQSNKKGMENNVEMKKYVIHVIPWTIYSWKHRWMF